MLERLTRFLAVDGVLPETERAAFEDARVDHNVRRVRMFVPLMLAVHVLHVIALWLGDEARRTMPAVDVEWHDGILANNAWMIPVTLVLLALARGDGPARPLHQRVLAEATFAIYTAYAAISTSVDQLITGSIHAFIMGALAPAVVFRLRFAGSAIAYAVGLTTLWIGTGITQSSEAVRVSNLAGASTVAALGLLLANSMSRAMAREHRAKRTIVQRTEELAAANESLEAIKKSLEDRVAAQVGEIVRRAAEVDSLNAQLMERVRERSDELSRALAQLAEARSDHGVLAKGTEIGGRVVIERLLGQGGMGAVYLGRDRVSGSDVAIKVVRATNADELDALQRFLREARAAASISHAGIVRSLHVDVDSEGRFFQILELVEGQTLSADVAQRKGLPAAQAARIGSVLASALAAAHRAGVVHRDVKPANVMLTRREPGVKLLDFGIAKAREVARGELGRTRTGMIVGTPEFIAPEQIERPLDVSPSSDVYTLGLVLFFMVANRLVFDPPGGAPAFLFAHIALEPPKLDEVVPGAPKELVALIDRCLQKAPEARPSAEELADSLRRIADEAGCPQAADLGLSEPLERTEVPVFSSGTQVRDAAEAPTRVAIPDAAS